MKPLVRSFDVAASRMVGRLPHGLHKPFDVLGYMTSPPVWAGLLVVYIAAAIPSGVDRWAALATLVALPAAGIIKFLFRRERPPTMYAGSMRIRSYSFPSSHAYCAVLAGGFFSHSCFIDGLPLIGAALAGLAVIIGVSRVYLGAHYPSDVVAGWLGGGIVLVIISWLT